jgi:hypothetical protein
MLTNIAGGVQRTVIAVVWGYKDKVLVSIDKDKVLVVLDKDKALVGLGGRLSFPVSSFRLSNGGGDVFETVP